MTVDKELNPLEYIDNPYELEVQRELNRKGIENDECPTFCPKCWAYLIEGGGMVGETVLYCPVGHGIFWEDSEDIIRRIL